MALRLLALVMIALSTSVFSQVANLPIAAEWNRTVTVAAKSSADSDLIGCFSVAPPADQSFTATVEAGFAGSLRIARGALCAANAVQTSADFAAGTKASATIRSRGGRYLVLIFGKPGGGSGRFTLKVGNDQALAGGQTLEPDSMTTMAQAQVGLDAPKAQDEEPLSARRALMLAQVEQRRIAVAEEQERNRIAAAEAARREEEARIAAMRREAEIAAANANQTDNTAMIVGAFFEGFNRTMQQANNSAQVAESYNQQIRDMEADYRARQEQERAAAAARNATTAEQRRVADENLRAAQARVAAANGARDNSGTSNGSGSSQLTLRRNGSSTTSEGAAKLETYFLSEKMVYCADADPNLYSTGGVYCQASDMLGSTSILRDDRAFFAQYAGGCSPQLVVTRPSGVPGAQQRVYGCGIPMPNSERPTRADHGNDSSLRRQFTCEGRKLKCITSPQPAS